MRTVWLDLETTGLNTEFTNIVGLAYWPEIKQQHLCPRGPRYLRVQPVLHMEDHIYGGEKFDNVLAHFNANVSRDDPDFLLGCVLRPKTEPVFAYSRSSLTFQMPPPTYRNPSEWLLDKTRIGAAKALSSMLEDLDSIEPDGTSATRWTFASYNVSFDLAVLKGVARRVFGESNARSYFNNFSPFGLDILQLARWGIHSGAVPTQQAGLKVVAAALGVPHDADPNTIALSDLLAAHKVASTLLTGTVPYDLNQESRSSRGEVSPSNPN